MPEQPPNFDVFATIKAVVDAQWERTDPTRAKNYNFGMVLDLLSPGATQYSRQTALGNLAIYLQEGERTALIAVTSRRASDTEVYLVDEGGLKFASTFNEDTSLALLTERCSLFSRGIIWEADERNYVARLLAMQVVIKLRGLINEPPEQNQ